MGIVGTIKDAVRNMYDRLVQARKSAALWIMDRVRQLTPRGPALGEASERSTGTASYIQNLMTSSPDEKGVRSIVRTIRRKQNKYSNQMTGLCALSMLAQSEETATAIRKTGGITEIIRTMKRFPTDRLLQQLAFKALASLSVDIDSGIAIRRAGGIKAIIASMKENLSTIGIQSNGCQILANLAMESYNAKLIKQQDAVVIINAALRMHPHSGSNARTEELHTSAHNALIALGEKVPDSQFKKSEHENAPSHTFPSKSNEHSSSPADVLLGRKPKKDTPPPHIAFGVTIPIVEGEEHESEDEIALSSAQSTDTTSTAPQSNQASVTSETGIIDTPSPRVIV